MNNNFSDYLLKHNLSQNTITTYTRVIDSYFDLFSQINKNNLLNFKEHCATHYKPSTANIYINALNKYLDFRKLGALKLKLLRVQQKSYLENVISNEDYRYLKNQLKKEGKMKWYFVFWSLAATGSRISELLQIKVENLLSGYVDMRTKGGKIRRIYIPDKLCMELLQWLNGQNIDSGFVFLNRSGSRITRSGIIKAMKTCAEKYNIDVKVMHPHSFRHRYAKNFLEKYNDIALLADLMGHESIETTRIYLRMTAGEQREIVNKVVTW